MDARPNYRIIKLIPHYDDRDGISGWTRRVVHTTMTQAWAHALVGMWDDGLDECSYEVHHRDGYRVFRDWEHKAAEWAYQNEVEEVF